MSPNDELVQLVDEQNNPTTAVSRWEMRTKRLLHRCTYVFVFNSARQLFVQTRTMTKDIYPGYFDLAAGGVTAAGESYDHGAVRELEEELGISGVAIKHHGVVYFEDELSRVFGAVYSCVWDGPMRFQPEEVVDGRFLELSAIHEMAAAGAKITPDSLQALQLVED
jgi:isopentenyldiphosphate isomerase